MEIDLWGNEIKKPLPFSPKGKGYCQMFKSMNGYHKSDDKQKQCGLCENSRHYDYHDKYYWKCIKLGVSNSEATDIRKSYVCNKFKIKDGIK